MTNATDLSWDRLNAYVDGELDADAAAAVASALVSDADAAAKVATLTRLRAAVKAMPVDDHPPPFSFPAQRKALYRRFSWAAAMLVAVLGAAWMATFASTTHRSPLADAISAHRAWLEGAAGLPRGRVEIEFAGARASALPDLTLASLRLAYLSLDPSVRRGGGMLAGYVGPSGCRVSLWIGPAVGDAQDRPVKEDRDGFTIRSWRTDGASYALLGRGIDEERLDRIAALVVRLTRQGQDVPAEHVAALAEARNVRPACLG